MRSRLTRQRAEDGDAAQARGDRLRDAIVSRPTFAGLTVGLLFWWQSLAPTLMPRTWVNQAALTAICAAIGIALGTLAGTVAQNLLRRAGRSPNPKQRQIAWRVLAVVAAVTLVAGIVLWPAWQGDQRELVSLDRLPWVQVLPMVLLSIVLSALLVTIGRIVGRGVRRLYRLLDRRLPSWTATPVTVVLVVVVASFVFGDLAGPTLVSWANTSFGAVDRTTTEGTERPTSRYSSGSPESLVAWDSLGRHGRDFVAGATPKAELQAFHGDDASVQTPIRVYVGDRSADSVEERADLAVRELERTGAFDRELLVVATATGSGWIDPDAAEAVEQVHGGDTAIVSMQYSFLPSWIATLVDPHASVAASSALFEAVHERWEELPEADRPQLVVFGLSLGSYGTEAAFAGPDAKASLANLRARTDGALFVGPTGGNEIWSQVTADREPGTPVWRPVYDEGHVVRFENRDPEVGALDPDWEGPRVLYLQHPTDPVTFWDIRTMWSPPDWMDSPRGVGVPTQGRWFPIVTGVQGVFDLMAGFGAPPGFGHDYRLDYVAGWAIVAPAPGWTADDTKALDAFLQSS